MVGRLSRQRWKAAGQAVRSQERRRGLGNPGGLSVSQGTHTPDSVSITFRKAAEQWVERARRRRLGADDDRRLRSARQAASQSPLRRREALTAKHADGRGYRDKLVDKLSRPMAIRVLRSLTSIIAEAQRRGQVAQNVALAVRVKRQQRQRAKATIPPKATLKAFLAASQAADDRQAAPLIMLGIFAGLRASELRGCRGASSTLPS